MDSPQRISFVGVQNRLDEVIARIPDLTNDYRSEFPRDRFTNDDVTLLKQAHESHYNAVMVESVHLPGGMHWNQEPQLFEKRWGASREDLQEFMAEARADPENKFKVIYEGNYRNEYAPVAPGDPNSVEYRLFSDVCGPRVPMDFGKSYVAFAFSDLSWLLHNLPRADCAKTSAAQGHGSSPVSHSGPRVLHFTGYDCSPVVVAKTLVLLECLRAGVGAPIVAELWFSMTWSQSALDAFRQAVSAAQKQELGSALVRDVLEEWAAAVVPSVKDALEKLRGGAMPAPDRPYEHEQWERLHGCHLAFCLTERGDRMDAARYFLRRAFPPRASNHLYGSVMALATPGKYGTFPLEDTVAFYALPVVSELLKEPGRLFRNLATYVHERITLMASLMQARRLEIQVACRTVRPEDRSFFEDVRALHPAAINWGHLADLFHPRRFHRIAKACSSLSETIHIGHSQKWTQRMYGTSILDCETADRAHVLQIAQGSLSDIHRSHSHGRVAQDAYHHPLYATNFSLAMVMHVLWKSHFQKFADMDEDLCKVVVRAPRDPLFSRSPPGTIFLVWNYGGKDMNEVVM